MKKLILKHIYGIIGIPVITFAGLYFYSYVAANEFNPAPASYVHSYETDEHNFYNGEILPPDKIHLYTLIVTDADFLNEMIVDDKYEVASDGDINDLLQTATKKVVSITQYIVKK